MNNNPYLFLPILLISIGASAQQFTKVVPSNAVPLYDASASWFDFDNDGDLDFITTGKTDINDLHCILYTNSNNNFTPASAPFNTLPSFAETGITFINTNGDDSIDLLLIGRRIGLGSMRIEQLENRSTGFVAVGELPGFKNIDGNALVASGDVNNDGRPDLFISNISEFSDGNPILTSRIYLRTSEGYILKADNPFVPLYLGMARLADFDNDEDLDLIVSGNDNSYPMQETLLYWNDGAGNFTQSPVTFTKLQNTAIDLADYDGDHDLDILMAGFNEFLAFETRLFKNTEGNFSSVALPSSINRTASGSVQWADYDNDGDPDILISGGNESEPVPTKKMAIFKNNGNSIFSEVPESSFGVIINSVNWGDYDNDGDLDILAEGGTDQFGENENLIPALQIYRNDGDSKNTSPSEPTHLSVEAISKTVWHLTWDSSTDDHTPPESLTYNLSLIMNEPNQIIMSPFSDKSGKRKIVGAGNVWLNRSWNFKNLPVGSYTVQVQSIDGGLSGSAFSEPVLLFSGAPQAAPADLVAEYYQGVSLRWNDNSNNEEYFVIERRTNGGAFEKIDSVTYGITTFTDTISNSGLHEYRVHAVNPNGRTEHTNIASLLITGTEKSVLRMVSIYPNPTTDLITLQSREVLRLIVSLHDISGKVVWQQNVHIEEGQAQLNISTLPKGIYVMKVQDFNGHLQLTKLLKH